MADFQDPALDPLNLTGLSTGDSLIERRGVLGALGMAGAACLVGSLSTSASAEEVVVRVGGDALKHLDLPEHWLSRNRYAGVYYRYLESLKLRHIDPAQVLSSHAKERDNIWNTLPPRQWWKRMGYVLKVVDRIAKEMNADGVEVVSAYRCPAYNARCYGAKKGSWHQANVATDVSFAGIKPSQVTSTARRLRSLGLFRGGVGGYRNFTHVDARGFNADW